MAVATRQGHHRQMLCR